MLWLCIVLPRLPLEALHPVALDPVDTVGSSASLERSIVVTSREGKIRWVVCGNPAAERNGVKTAMNCAVALAMHPLLTMLERNPRAERSTLERLAAWAYQFSNTVIPGEISQDLHLAGDAKLWLEIGASLKLFGGLRRLIERLESELQTLHCTYRLGIGPTLEGAAVLARAEIRVAITTSQALCTRIHDLPLCRLAPAPSVSQPLHSLGVRTIGALLKLPRAAVVQRFGIEFGHLLERLTGRAADPRPAFRLPENYHARIEFELDVGSNASLLFPLRRVLHEFAGYLCARDTGVQHFTLSLVHRDRVPTEVRIGLLAPDRNPERFFALVRQRFEGIQLCAPVVALVLAANRFAPPNALQTDLLNGAPQQNEEFAHTIDRIAARLGEERIFGLETCADHRPEASWKSVPFDPTCARSGALESAAMRRASLPKRPLWLLSEPKPLQRSVIPRIVANPERIESGWWDNGDVCRDYYIVRTSTGADLWVYRDLSDLGWYLHGFWS